MKTIPEFHWDADAGLATCVLYDGKHHYTGTATCHPEDLDMMSEKTGLHIAQERAVIKALKALKIELQGNIASLEQFYYSINRNKYFNPKNYEIRILMKNLQIYKEDLIAVENYLNKTKKELREFITNKNLFYQEIRKNREKGNQDKIK